MFMKPNPYDVKADKKLEELVAFNRKIAEAIRRASKHPSHPKGQEEN